jgi:rhodanese-related sulfurtransferase
MSSKVTATPPGNPADTTAHFATKLMFETDCSDVHETLQGGRPDFVLLDVRGRDSYARGHVPGATSLPHWEITPERMAAWPVGTMFVAYCAGAHCNGADKGAFKLSRLGFAVKIMIGGVSGWAAEGFAFAPGADAGRLGLADVA